MDFNGDGRLDLLTGSNCCDSASFYLFRRKLDGSWAPSVRLGMKNHLSLRACFVTAADWNGDGVPDLLTVAGLGKGIAVAPGPFRADEPIDVSARIDLTPWHGVDDYITDFAVADWDRDGKPDVLIRQSVGGVERGIYWYRNLGGTGLTTLAERKRLVTITPDMHVQGFCVSDWNGDGRPDLILTRSDESIKGDDGKHIGWRGSVWLYQRE